MAAIMKCCKDLNLPLCMSCISKSISHANPNCCCWVEHYCDLLDQSGDIPNTILKWLMNDNVYSTFSNRAKGAHIYFIAALNIHFPQYVETFNKYAILI
jgi:hypothetical protein